jgi:hypothetical protein
MPQKVTCLSACYNILPVNPLGFSAVAQKNAVYPEHSVRAIQIKNRLKKNSSIRAQTVPFLYGTKSICSVLN